MMAINILQMLAVLIGYVPADCRAVVQIGCPDYFGIETEVPVIAAAAARNGIEFGSDDWFLLLAIRKAENGRAGREMGIFHARADELIAADPEKSLDIQAAWAAATIMNQHIRFGSDVVTDDFIISLCDRWCPKSTDREGNIYLKRNVRFFYSKFTALGK